MLCFFLPSNARIMRLENSHRRFSIGMRDVAQAYHFAHAADREGIFQMSSEFDAVRECLAYLRDHPDLESLEPALLEAAAQMSHISRELADVYADEKVARAVNSCASVNTRWGSSTNALPRPSKSPRN